MRQRLGGVFDNGGDERGEPMDALVMRFWSRSPALVAASVAARVSEAVMAEKGPSIAKASPRFAAVIDLAAWTRARPTRARTRGPRA